MNIQGNIGTYDKQKKMGDTKYGARAGRGWNRLPRIQERDGRRIKT